LGERRRASSSRHRLKTLRSTLSLCAPRRKNQQLAYRPSNVGYMAARTAPSSVIDNWAAAWKVRRHWEEQTERRKAQGKPVY
jgi:hypothetical protein